MNSQHAQHVLHWAVIFELPVDLVIAAKHHSCSWWSEHCKLRDGASTDAQADGKHRCASGLPCAHLQLPAASTGWAQLWGYGWHQKALRDQQATAACAPQVPFWQILAEWSVKAYAPNQVLRHTVSRLRAEQPYVT